MTYFFRLSRKCYGKFTEYELVLSKVKGYPGVVVGILVKRRSDWVGWNKLTGECAIERRTRKELCKALETDVKLSMREMTWKMLEDERCTQQS